MITWAFRIDPAYNGHQGFDLWPMNFKGKEQSDRDWINCKGIQDMTMTFFFLWTPQGMFTIGQSLGLIPGFHSGRVGWQWVLMEKVCVCVFVFLCLCLCSSHSLRRFSLSMFSFLSLSLLLWCVWYVHFMGRTCCMQKHVFSRYFMRTLPWL